MIKRALPEDLCTDLPQGTYVPEYLDPEVHADEDPEVRLLWCSHGSRLIA